MLVLVLVKCFFLPLCGLFFSYKRGFFSGKRPVYFVLERERCLCTLFVRVARCAW